MRRAGGGRHLSRPGLLACAVLLACLAAGSLVVVLRGSGGGTPAAAGQLLSARTTLSSRSILFGDTVEARLNLILPGGTAQKQVRVRPDFDPFRIVSRRMERQGLGGGLEQVSISYVLRCIALYCLGAGPTKHVQFKPTLVSIPGRRLRAVWPPLVQVSRVQDVTAPVADGLTSGSAVSPGLGARRDAYEALGATGASLLLLLSAWLYVRRRARLRLAAQLRVPSVLRALLMRVEAGLPEDVLYRQRYALDALAVELRHRRVDGGLAVRAERLAWAPEQPDPKEIRALCEQIRRAVRT